jgi:hypothetical protein
MQGAAMTGIGRRLDKALGELEDGEYESAALSIFSALEATAKKRYPKKGNGDRFITFLSDQHDIVTAIGLGVVIGSLTVRGVPFAKSIWKLARNPLTHEAELDPRITFNNDDGTYITTGDREGNEIFNLSPVMLLGMAIATVAAKENSDEDVQLRGWFKFNQVSYIANSVWGAEADLRKSYTATVAGAPIPKLSRLRAHPINPPLPVAEKHPKDRDRSASLRRMLRDKGRK